MPRHGAEAFSNQDLKQAKKFSWQKCAKLLDFLKRLWNIEGSFLIKEEWDMSEFRAAMVCSYWSLRDSLFEEISRRPHIKMWPVVENKIRSLCLTSEGEWFISFLNGGRGYKVEPVDDTAWGKIKSVLTEYAYIKCVSEVSADASDLEDLSDKLSLRVAEILECKSRELLDELIDHLRVALEKIKK